MGEPTECGEPFEVSGAGATRDEAVERAQANADAACRRLKKGCNQAQDTGEPGSFKEKKEEITYVSNFICVGI